jgi:hypothetical protein
VETFNHYLDWVAKYYEGKIPPRRSLHLILDCYSIHRAREIREYIEALGTMLWCIPGGYPDKLQPLDRTVFGVMKAIFRRLFEQARHNAEDNRVRKLPIHILKEIWRDLSIACIREGWTIYEDPLGPDHDEKDADLEP